MVIEREIRRLLPKEPQEVLTWYKKEYNSKLKVEYTSGDRFVTLFQFDTSSPVERETYAAYVPNPGMVIRSISNHIPPAELPMMEVTTKLRPVQKALVYDKEAGKVIDLQNLLPEKFRLRIAEIDDTLKNLFRSQGVDPDIPYWRQLFSRGFPLRTGIQTKAVDVSIYRFYQDEAWKRDVLAEQLVYTIGQARALSHGIRAYLPVEQHAKNFLRQTYTGKMMLLGDSSEFR